MTTRKIAIGIAAGIIGGSILFMTGVAVGLYPTEVNGKLPAATKTISLPGATITPPPRVVTAPLLPRATITKTLPQATKTITIIKKVPSAIITCGRTEDDCYPDYIGKGRWVMRQGEPPARKVPQATKKVPRATIAGVCRHPSITRDMIADCNKLASRPAEVTAAYSNPRGTVLVRECTEQYTGEELRTCLR